MTTRNKRKKSRRRIHYGRLMIVLSVPLLLILTIIWLIKGFGATVPEEEYTPEAQVTENNPPVADADECVVTEDSDEIISPVQAGRRDAARALAFPAGSMERQELLLSIYAREWKLRNAGFPHSADDYIKAVRESLGE